MKVRERQAVIEMIARLDREGEEINRDFVILMVTQHRNLILAPEEVDIYMTRLEEKGLLVLADPDQTPPRYAVNYR